MEIGLSSAKDLLGSGKFIFSLLVPALKQQLNLAFPGEAPLFLKTMAYYKVFPQELLRESREEEIISALQVKADLIQTGISIQKIKQLPALDYGLCPMTEEDTRLLELRICEVQGGTFRGASHPFFMGLLFFCPANFRSETEELMSIVHELAHQELFLLNTLDRLVSTSTNPRLIHSPLQGRERPAIGRLHSGHALYRMIQLEKKRPTGNEEKFSRLLKATIQTFEPAELTDFGNDLLTFYKEIL